MALAVFSRIKFINIFKISVSKGLWDDIKALSTFYVFPTMIWKTFAFVLFFQSIIAKIVSTTHQNFCLFIMYQILCKAVEL